MEAKLILWVDIETPDPTVVVGLRDTLVQTARLTEWNQNNVLVSSRIEFADCEYEDFVTVAEYEYRKYPHYRRGQAYFNTLYDMKPELANSIRGGHYDPFYRDEVLPTFLGQVEDLWEKM